MGQELGRISGVMLKENLEINSPTLAVDTDLLYLDADNTSIGINSTATGSQTSLTINSATQTIGLIVDTELRLPNLTIKTNTNTISSVSGDLHLASVTSIVSPNIRTDDLNLNDNVISSTSSNQSIELRPAGAVEIPTNLNVTGNLFATGDILIEGTVVFGDTTDAVTETVKIKAEVNSDIIPTQNEIFSLGSDPDTGGARWLNTYINLLNGEIITATSVQANGVNLTQRQGNTWYVSKNGNNTNYGDHEASTFLTIKRALDNVALESGDTIIVYPGTYTEIFPLTVPVGVAIRGTSIRSVTIIPTAGTNTESAFLLNGETTVSDLTVKDFYAPGYAFSFASNASISTRSPYIQNVTVITKGTVTSASDLRGFAAGDAGGGALVNGASVNSASKEASMLFHSVTFITPGVDALVMTNGVRVEWLNGFTYFANRAMYATSGVGRIDSNNSVTRYGAEVRAIGSASVYGNYGAWADGQGTLMYLINHNFSYIGSGKASTNDPSVHTPANEVIMLNFGDIHYQSFDNDGNFHIGNPFSVSFNDGTASINGVSVTATGVSSILFGSETSKTIVNAGLVSTGNIKFSGNILTTTLGTINLVPGVGKINLTSDVSAKQNIAIDNDFSLKGVLTLGNQLIDMAEFKAPTDSDILPSVDRTFSFGSNQKRWNNVINQLSVIDSNIRISDNVIQSTLSSADLELRAQGSGIIALEINDLIADNQLTVNGTSNTNNIGITGFLHQTGNILQTGNRSISNGAAVTGNISATIQAVFETITVSAGQITTTASNADLELRAAGTGQVTVPTANVLIQNDLTVNGTMTASTAVITNQVVSTQFDNPDISFYANTIITKGLNQNLIIGAHGVGTVTTEMSDVLLGQNLQVDGLSTLSSVVIVGDTVHNGTFNLTGDITRTGNYSLSNNLIVSLGVQFANIEIENNVITTTDSNSDLELRASGTGLVKVDDDFTIENNLNVNGIIATNGLTNSGIIESDTFRDNDVEISTNVIKTTVGNNDLRLLAAGTGVISVPNDAVQFNQNLTVNSITDMTSVQIGQENASISLIQTLNNPTAVGTSALDNFAKVVAVSGNYAIVGVPTEDGAGGRSETFSGYAYIFNVTTGALVHTLANPNAFGLNRFDFFGWSVAISDNYAIVGVPDEDDAGGINSGKAYVFNVATGALVHTLDNPNAYGASARDDFGDSVAISGNYAIVGASFEHDASGSASGKAYIYNVTTGVLVHTLDNPNAYGTSASDFFGVRVAISGNYAIVGSNEADAGGAYAGKAYIFNVTTGALVHTLNNPNAYSTSASDQFGIAVAISGNYAIVGARNEGDAGGTSSGKAYIFNVTTGALVHTLDNPNAYGTSVSDQFGESVAISGDYAIVGVPDEDDAGGTTSGKAYIFNVTTGALLYTLDNPNAYDTSAGDNFGNAVAISGDYIIVGALTEDDAGGTGSGKAYVFSGLPSPATLTVTGTINRTGNTIETGNYTLSNILTVSGTVSLTNIEIDNNVITTTDSNSDLELRAAAGGRIYASYSNVAITNDLRVNGITTTSVINNSGVVYSDTFKTTDLIISQNYITSQPNTNIKLIAAGLGNVVLPKITIDANAIKATALNNNIELTVSAGSVIIPTTNALKIPVGTTANKSANTVGDIRLDTTDTLFTGWNGARVTFGGLFSTDRRTTVLAHPTNNSINFVTNTNATMSLTASGLTVNALLVNSDLQITGTTISSTVSGSNITLTSNNNGYLELGNIRINTNNIQNVDTSSTIILENTGSGYVKFGGTGGIAIPAGTELTRPASPETGDFRFNTNLSTAEVFNGIDYVSLGGTSNALLNAEEIQEITNLYALILG